MESALDRYSISLHTNLISAESSTRPTAARRVLSAGRQWPRRRFCFGCCAVRASRGGGESAVVGSQLLLRAVGGSGWGDRACGSRERRPGDGRVTGPIPSRRNHVRVENSAISAPLREPDLGFVDSEPHPTAGARGRWRVTIVQESTLIVPAGSAVLLARRIDTVRSTECEPCRHGPVDRPGVAQ